MCVTVIALRLCLSASPYLAVTSLLYTLQLLQKGVDDMYISANKIHTVHL